MAAKSEKLWSGRFDVATDALMERFSESISFDARLWRQDIAGSRAHARMLAAQGILSEAERDAILGGLEQVAGELERGELEFDPALEDIHTHIEARLTEIVGAAGGKLHSGRSRNDQIATDIRLYLREAVDGGTGSIVGELDALRRGLVDLAEKTAEVIIPGYTHLQRAQPVTMGHHLLAYYEMLTRDRGRFVDALRRMDVSPLGSGALAGTTLPLDRAATARDMGFAAFTRNSMDAVADRDFAVELCAAASLCMVHLSRLSEDLILWASEEMGYVDLPDAFCTGSSIMPQKKNPDVPELVRGKTGRVVGDLVSLLTLMKGLPLTYNRDMQEDKEALFDAMDTVGICLAVCARMVPGIAPRPERCEAAVARGFMGATDLADYLVRKGLPFRQCHAVAAGITAEAISQGRTLEDLSLEDLRRHSDLFEADALDCLNARGMVEGRDLPGGPAPSRVREAVAAARELMQSEASAA